MKGALVLLSSLLSMAASQGPMGMNRIPFHHHAIAAVEKMTFGTFGQPMKFDCKVPGCSWADNVVHEDWMFYGAGWGNPEAMDPTICAKRCALDINCAAFEYDVDKHTNTNYCSWWKVGSCGFDKGSFIGDLTRRVEGIAETCSKVPAGEESYEEFEGETGFNGGESGESGQEFESSGGESGESGQEFESNGGESGESGQNFEVRLF